MVDAILKEDVDKTKHPLIGFHYPSVNTMAERSEEKDRITQ